VIDIETQRAEFAEHGRGDTYLDTIESVIGLPLRSTEAAHIDMRLDDCVRLGERLQSFYDIFPLSSASLLDDIGISPIYTSDVTHLQHMRSALSGIGARFGGETSTGAGRLANLFLYARSTVMSDDLAMLIDQIGTDTPGRMSDAEIVAEVNDCLKSLCYLRDLIRADVITLYYPSGVWRQLYEQLQDELILGTGLGPMETFREWMMQELVTDPDLLAHADTYAAMAMSEMSESLVFCSMLGRNSAPVLSGPVALSSYESLVRAVTPALARELPTIRDATNLYSFSTVDLSQLPPKALADLRFDSAAFETWQGFLTESLEETRIYNQQGKAFDQALRRSLLRRGKEFELRVTAEFGRGALEGAFQFNSTNAVGFMAGVSGSVLTGTTLLTSLLVGGVALTVERLYSVLQLNARRNVESIVRNHYHAFTARPVGMAEDM